MALAQLQRMEQNVQSIIQNHTSTQSATSSSFIHPLPLYLRLQHLSSSLPSLLHQSELLYQSKQELAQQLEWISKENSQLMLRLQQKMGIEKNEGEEEREELEWEKEEQKLEEERKKQKRIHSQSFQSSSSSSSSSSSLCDDGKQLNEAGDPTVETMENENDTENLSLKGNTMLGTQVTEEQWMSVSSIIRGRVKLSELNTVRQKKKGHETHSIHLAFFVALSDHFLSHFLFPIQLVAL